MKMKSFEKIPETTDQSDEISGNLTLVRWYRITLGGIGYTYAQRAH